MKYEQIYILTPKYTEDEAKEAIKKLNDKITKKGAAIEREDFWGKKKLAYPIQKLDHGYYMLIVFEAEATVPADIEKMMQIEKEVLRSLVVKYEEAEIHGAPGEKKAKEEEAKKVAEAEEKTVEEGQEEVKSEVEDKEETPKETKVEEAPEEKTEDKTEEAEKEEKKEDEEEDKPADKDDKVEKSKDKDGEDVDVDDLEKRLDDILKKI
ncbi:30S ribosomal protein S6 [Patescibacteria group bacterium]|nr:30S ribosomal protein S6 [Patescibacteria group bacterium]